MAMKMLLRALGLLPSRSYEPYLQEGVIVAWTHEKQILWYKKSLFKQ